MPRNISSVSVVNVARTANGQTFILLHSPHYRGAEEAGERAAAALLISDKDVDVSMHCDGGRAADCTVSISGN